MGAGQLAGRLFYDRMAHLFLRNNPDWRDYGSRQHMA